MSKQLFLNDVETYTQEELKQETARLFDIDKLTIDDCEFLIADIDNGGYDGYAYFLFMKNENLYEVYGAHCSCYGFEDQWNPEETTFEYLQSNMWRHRDNQQMAKFVKEFLN